MVGFNNLTKQQKDLWLDCKKSGSNSSYNTIVQLEISGQLEEKKLLQAVSSAFEHFHMFRTYFAEEGSNIMQKTDDYSSYSPEYYDFSKEQNDLAEENSLNLIRSKLNENIDLSRPPLAKAILAKVSSEKYHFAIITHHIISDGESARIILNYISKYYSDPKEMEEYSEKFNVYDFVDIQNSEKDRNDSLNFWKDEIEKLDSEFCFYRKKNLGS